MTWTKSCQVDTTSGVDMAEVMPTWHNFRLTRQSRDNLARLLHMKSCQVGTTCPNL